MASSESGFVNVISFNESATTSDISVNIISFLRKASTAISLDAFKVIGALPPALAALLLEIGREISSSLAAQI